MGIQNSNDASQSDRSVFITGAAGFVGKHLIKNLSRSNQNVIAIYRKNLPDALQNVYPVCSDLSNIEMLKIPLRGVHTVVHLAWDRSFSLSNPESGRQSPQSNSGSKNLEALRNLLQAMEVAKTRRIVFASTADASEFGDHFFKQEKYLAEHMILNSSVPEKVILRCPLIVAPLESGYFMFRSLQKVLSIPFIAPMPAYRKTIKPIHINDYVAALNLLISKPLPAPCFFSDIEGEEAFTSEELLQLLRQHLDKGVRLKIKGPFAHALIRMLEGGKRPQHEYPRLSQWVPSAFTPNEAPMIGNFLPSLINQKSSTSIKTALTAKSAAARG